MYRMLIADSEIPAVHALENAIDWQKWDIQEVYTAFDCQQAGNILGNVNMDLILCDIRMKEKNGSSFMHQARKTHAGARIICLSNQMMPEMILDAMRSGCQDYLTKPVDANELEQSIERAVYELRAREAINDYERLKQQSRANLAGAYVQFWNDVLGGTLASDRRTLIRAGEERGLVFGDPAQVDHFRYVPIGMKVCRWINGPDHQERRKTLFALRNIAEETMLKSGLMGQVFPYEPMDLLGCFMMPEYLTPEDLQIRNVLEGFAERAEQYYACRLRIVIGNAGRIVQMAGQVRQISDIVRNVIGTGAVIETEQGKENLSAAEETLPPLEAGVWKDLILQGNEEDLLKAIREYFSSAAGEGMLRVSQLRLFRQMFARLVYSNLQLERLNLYNTATDSQLIRMEEEAPQSLEATMEWCLRVANAVRNVVRGSLGQESSTADQIMAYVEAHLDAPLSREELSRVFYLNPDYIGKMFKRTAGTGLNAYIQEARIRRACTLLAQTTVAIGDIADQVGFQNFSYFGKVFRDQVGMTPQQYRKRQQNVRKG